MTTARTSPDQPGSALLTELRRFAILMLTTWTLHAPRSHFVVQASSPALFGAGQRPAPQELIKLFLRGSLQSFGIDQDPDQERRLREQHDRFALLVMASNDSSRFSHIRLLLFMFFIAENAASLRIVQLQPGPGPVHGHQLAHASEGNIRSFQIWTSKANVSG
jgi:hypothetical protein